jgi:hypothetical protein
MTDLSPLTQALVGAAASAITLLAGVLLARLPLLLTALRVWIDGADATFVRHALSNAAVNAARAIDGGQPMERAIADIVGYVQANLPGRLGRLKVPPETLDAMASAALARVLAGRG